MSVALFSQQLSRTVILRHTNSILARPQDSMIAEAKLSTVGHWGGTSLIAKIVLPKIIHACRIATVQCHGGDDCRILSTVADWRGRRRSGDKFQITIRRRKGKLLMAGELLLGNFSTWPCRRQREIAARPGRCLLRGYWARTREMGESFLIFGEEIQDSWKFFGWLANPISRNGSGFCLS